MELKVNAFLLIRPAKIRNGTLLRTIHFWTFGHDQEKERFKYMEQVYFNGSTIMPIQIRIDGAGKILSEEFKDIPLFPHNTFADCVEYLELNGHFGIVPMSERIQHYPFLASAFMLANISKSRRRACAALIVRRETNIAPVIISSGVNGTPVGKENLCEDNLCELSSPEVIHAEVNAFRNMNIEEDRKLDTMYITDSPCPDCLNFLRLNTDIRKIVFSRSYRITDHLVEEREFTLIHIPEKEIVDYINASEHRMFQTIS